LIKHFFSLTKPGIIFGNLITAAAGFFLAAKGNVNPWLFLATLVGITLVIASGCIVNNYIDQDIDKLMQRTRNRVLVLGLISGKAALSYAVILGLLGLLILYVYTNILAVIIACIGLFVYIVLYSLWLKRNSIYGTLIGSISGSVPPLIGYCAVTSRIDGGAILLFFMLSLWQMPHSFAIAIFRLMDYKSANVAVLPVKKSIYFTKLSMLLYLIAFFIVSLLLTVWGYTGIIYFIVALVTGVWWLIIAISGFKALDNKIWARKMFVFSILAIAILCLTMSLDVIKA
jgi:protoheme IX farnesyltransferase